MNEHVDFSDRADFARLRDLAEKLASAERLAPFERLATARKEAPTGTYSKRVELLHEAARLTGGERNKEYGEPRLNLQCAGELKDVLRKWRNRSISPAELEAIDMVCTKLSRVVCGKPKADTYTDLAAYAAIAGEIGLADAAERDELLAKHQPDV